MGANLRALRQRSPASPTLRRYDEVAAIISGEPAAEAGVAWLKELVAALAIPPLSAYGVTPADFPAIVAQSRQASSMKGNPIGLTEAELTDILAQAIG
jgi:alcohol dehydrogenase class IV